MRSWEKNGPKYESDTEKAKRILSEIVGLQVISLTELDKGQHYQLRVKSELVNRSYSLFKTPWEFTTDWYTINFVY